ncbi:MAG: rRNA maturation RNase YbeY [Pirellulaceae bacterium]
MPESNTLTSNSPHSFQGAIEINQAADFEIDEPLICSIISRILGDAGFRRGSVSIAIVDDPTIHELNRQYLQHDYATDVLSFVLDRDDTRDWLEGEVIASFETARQMAADYDWAPASELLLYLIHGTLHLTGLEDAGDEQRQQMREAESRYLSLAGLEQPPEEPGEEPTTVA